MYYSAFSSFVPIFFSLVEAKFLCGHFIGLYDIYIIYTYICISYNICDILYIIYMYNILYILQKVQ